MFLSLVCSAIKTKPQDKTRYIFKTTTNIKAVALRRGCCAACKAQLDQLLMCER